MKLSLEVSKETHIVIWNGYSDNTNIGAKKSKRDTRIIHRFTCSSIGYLRVKNIYPCRRLEVWNYNETSYSFTTVSRGKYNVVYKITSSAS